jgi:leucyl aminopeptidase (aminopeptidase T)
MDQVVAGTMVDPDRLQAAGAPLARALQRGRRVRIWDDRGTDLTLRLAGRRAVVDAGRVTKEDMKRPNGMLNLLPAGAVRVSLDETVADGTVVANRPSYNDVGMSTGGLFEFRGGRLVRHHYDRGARFFDSFFRRAGKGRDRPGYLAIGLNPSLRNTPQLEDREAGAITVAVGNNSFLPGGKNTAAFTGIVVNAGARVEIDGRPLRLPG